jgi:hypothetical protein
VSPEGVGVSLTPAQRKALKLVVEREVVVHPDGRGHVVDRSTLVARRTVKALFDQGLVEYDPLYSGHLRLSEVGRLEQRSHTRRS